MLALPFLVACGAASTREPRDPARSARQDLQAAASNEQVGIRSGPVTSLPEAWPQPASGDADRLVDGDTSGAQYEIDTSIRLPWTLVLRVLDAPASVAALGLHAPDAARSITDISVFAYRGSVPLNRANYPQFLEGSTRLGMARVEARDGWTILTFDEPVLAHFVWFRVSGDATAQGVALSEVRLFSADELAVLTEQAAESVRFAALRPVDTAPYEGINLLGLSNLGDSTNPLTAPGDPDEGSGVGIAPPPETSPADAVTPSP